MRRVGGAGRSGGLRFLGYRWRYVQMLVAVVAMGMIVICIQAPHILFKTNDSNPEIQSKSSSLNSISESGWDQRDDQTPSNNIIAGTGFLWDGQQHSLQQTQEAPIGSAFRHQHRLARDRSGRAIPASLSLKKMAENAWFAGAKAWIEIEEASGNNNNNNNNTENSFETKIDNRMQLKTAEGRNVGVKNPLVTKDLSCPLSLSMTGKELKEANGEMLLPCGLQRGSVIKVVGKPHAAHVEYMPRIAQTGAILYANVSQFVVELKGLKAVDGEEPPRILHVNPRLKGDWSSHPVIEHNTCYRGQWGQGLRCEGWEASDSNNLVDGKPKCEKWLRKDEMEPEPETAGWLEKLLGQQETMDWGYPFAEGHSFVLTVQAGHQGFHINVDGRHISSFPYRFGYVVEEATGVTVAGDVEVDTVMATELPHTHPSFTPELVLEFSEAWKAPHLPTGPIDLFIGILSSSNHFAARMAIRKTWLQYQIIRSSNVVARFFVALHSSKSINLELKKEAAYFGDIVIVPFLDHYDLVVLKTVAICDFGVRNVSAKHVMKCDDDTFVRVDRVLQEVSRVSTGQGLYMGNMNEYHVPLRTGKWAVTFEEWPEIVYPTYANGPGYIVSQDIAHFIASCYRNDTLRLFKMEDVSMGMWVGQFGVTNKNVPLHYENSLRFCQFGCVEHFFTAHYQSPRTMLCMWEAGDGKCCNKR